MHVAVHHISNMTVENLQKMTEAIFHGSQTKVTIFTTDKYKAAMGERHKTERKERPTYGLIIKQGGKSYKEVLGQVKKIIGTSSATNAIRTVRSTKDNNLLITMDKDEKAMDKVKEAIKNISEGIKVRELGRNDEYETLHIKGMDAESTRDNLLEELTKILGTWDEEYNRLSELRPQSNETQAATLTVKKEEAVKLLRAEHIRVGLVRCRIEKRLRISRCTKCWEYDHKANDCNGPSRAALCYKCGKENHVADQCKNAETCPVCDKTGHKAGTMKCPAFKKALNRARAMERREIKLRRNDTAKQNMDEHDLRENLDVDYPCEESHGLTQEAEHTLHTIDNTN